MKNIAVLFAGLTIKTTYEIIEGIRDCASANNCNIFLFTCARRYDENIKHDIGEYNIFHLPNFQDFDGVILINSSIGTLKMQDAIAEQILKSRIPAVSCERYREGMYNVMIDNKAAMRSVIEHFVDGHGFKRIGFVTGPDDNSEAIDRFEAYKEVLAEHGIELDEQLIYHGDFLGESGVKAGKYFYDYVHPLPEAIACANDVMALGVYSYLERKGVTAPGQISIAGFDDDKSAQYFEPRLTSVAREQYKTGYAAAQKLIDGLKKEELGKTLVLNTQLKRRESCGCQCLDVIDNVRFRRKHFLNEENMARNIQFTMDMAIDLTTVNSMEEFRNVMAQSMSFIKCESFFIVLNKGWMGQAPTVEQYEFKTMTEQYMTEGYKEECELAFGYKKGEILGVSDVNFKKLLSELKADSAGRNVYMFCPLHYRDCCFGYCVIGNCDFPFENMLFYVYLMNIGNALESIKKQEMLRAVIKKLDAMWIYDTLTGLYNRAGFFKFGNQKWEEYRRKNKQIALLFMDVDGLKIVNDTYGHEEGDKLIKTVADTLRKCMHSGDLIMRYGGDEFVIMLEKGSDIYAQEYVDDINESLAIHNRLSKRPYKVSVSIGIHLVDFTENKSLQEAIEQADHDMYIQKKNRKRAKKEDD